MKKRMLTMLLAGAMLLSLAGCGGKTGETSSPPENSSAPSEKVEANSQAPADSGWPTKDTLNILIPAKAGGVNDTIARIMQEYLQSKCGATVIVTNYDTKPVAYSALVNAKNDGYTIMLQHTTLFPESAAGSSGVKPMEEMTVLGQTNSLGGSAYIAPSDAPYDNFEGLVAYAKDNPGKVTAAYAAGGLSHFQWGAIEQDAGIDLKMLDCASESEKMTNIAGGFLDLASVTYKTAKEYADAGKVKILSVVNLPEEAAEFGYQQMEDLGYTTLSVCYMYMWGPTGMDEGLVQDINKVLMEMGADAGVQEKMGKAGYPALSVKLADASAAAQAEMDAAVTLAGELGLAG